MKKGRLFLALRGRPLRGGGGCRSCSPPGDTALAGCHQRLELVPSDRSRQSAAHILNGHLMCTVIDDDPPHRMSKGLIGVQVHVGPPMKVEYRNFRLKEY